MRHRDDIPGLLLLGAALLLALAVYWPGLPSLFVLDDFPTLRRLGEIRDAGDIGQLLQFILSGTSGSGGRPVAHASFLLNDIHWPSQPWSFKYTNLMIHLLNGALVAWLTVRLARLGKLGARTAGLVAAAAAGLWLLHPFNVSTVLYIVQRMTQLATLFVLAGCLLYVIGRQHAAGRPLRGYLLMTLGAGGCGLLAVLSKENGVLLPALLLVIEFILLRRFGLTPPPRWTPWALLFLGLPLLLLAAWLGWHVPNIVREYQFRDFTLGERLLTEARALADYLYNIIAPRQHGTGPYQDDFAPSRGLLEPPATLPAVLLVAGLLGAAVALRRRAPLVSFALLWFFAAHALESSFIPLELYFEHRNYLPMIGILIAVPWLLSQLRARAAIIAIPALGGVALLSAWITLQIARLWSDPLVFAEVMLAEHPRSARAHQFTADIWINAKQPAMARQTLRRLIDARPELASPWIQLVLVHCHEGGDFADFDFDGIAAGLRNARRDTAVAPTLQAIQRYRKSERCRGLEVAELIRLVDTMIANPSFIAHPQFLSDLHLIRADLLAGEQRWYQAVRDLRRSYDLYPRVEVALMTTGILTAAGRYAEARAELARARAADRATPFGIATRGKRIEDWEAELRSLESKSEPAPEPAPAGQG